MSFVRRAAAFSFSSFVVVVGLAACGAAGGAHGGGAGAEASSGGMGGAPVPASGGQSNGSGGAPTDLPLVCAAAADPTTACPAAFAGPGETPSPLGLVPLPVSTTVGYGYLELKASTRIVAATAARAVAERLAADLRMPSALPLEVSNQCGTGPDIVLDLTADTTLGDEGYDVLVGCDRITVRAHTTAGLIWGAQTLRQLLPAPAFAQTTRSGVSWRVPHVHIVDRPRFAWRGFSLDVARHFFAVSELERLMDLASMHKLNRFHIHLSDDQGWRLTIDSWPKLTSVGSMSQVDSGSGGYYSKDDFRALVKYAAERGIVVVPELDFPGHTNAALASYPSELSETGMPPRAWPYRGIEVGFSSLWLGGPRTLDFVDDVVGELAALTPGPYLHLGGDEAQSTDADDYSEFVGQLEALATKHGKTLVGWAEIGRGDVSSSSIAQHWNDKDTDSLSAAVSRGMKVVMSPAQHAYLDMKYDSNTPVGMDWAGLVSVQTAYDWDPVSADVPETSVLGVEAALWTETVKSRANIDLLVFPRLCGHAEIGWSPQAGRSWAEYRQRLTQHLTRLASYPVGYYASPELL